MKIILGIFFVMHGLVHLLYAGQSRRLFELKPGMTWPDGSWLFTGVIGGETTRLLVSVCLALAALGYALSGLGLFLRQAWWQPLALASALLSSLIFLLFWNGKLAGLDAQGGVGLLINLAILAIVLFIKV
jgi:hypothetical protein